jgi:hypothetical protein
MAGLRVHCRLLLVELVEADSATLLLKPSEGVTVMVERPATPAFTVTLVGLADNEKSPTAWTKGNNEATSSNGTISNTRRLFNRNLHLIEVIFG